MRVSMETVFFYFALRTVELPRNKKDLELYSLNYVPVYADNK
jgi:hypothetical protein